MVSHAEEAPPPMLRLPAEYDEACIGHSLSPFGRSHWVYSLTKLAAAESRLKFIVATVDAAESVWEMVKAIAREHGDRMPVFVDDTESTGPKIWTPGG